MYIGYNYFEDMFGKCPSIFIDLQKSLWGVNLRILYIIYRYITSLVIKYLSNILFLSEIEIKKARTFFFSHTFLHIIRSMTYYYL